MRGVGVKVNHYAEECRLTARSLQVQAEFERDEAQYRIAEAEQHGDEAGAQAWLDVSDIYDRLAADLRRIGEPHA